jgi:hypothetical protein
MAVFLLKGEHGGGYTPPGCSATMFTDVPCPGAQFVDFINQLAVEGITGGCGGGNYCPANPVNRGRWRRSSSRRSSSRCTGRRGRLRPKKTPPRRAAFSSCERRDA